MRLGNKHILKAAPKGANTHGARVAGAAVLTEPRHISTCVLLKIALARKPGGREPMANEMANKPVLEQYAPVVAYYA